MITKEKNISATTVEGENPISSKNYTGDLFYEIHQTFYDQLNSQHVSQVIRIPRENTSVLYDVEIEWMIGPMQFVRPPFSS